MLIHGIGHRWQAWEPVLDGLAEAHDVIAIDLPGFGCHATRRQPPSVPALAAWVGSFFAELGVDRPHVAGNSLGGGLALELAAAGSRVGDRALPGRVRDPNGGDAGPGDLSSCVAPPICLDHDPADRRLARRPRDFGGQIVAKPACRSNGRSATPSRCGAVRVSSPSPARFTNIRSAERRPCR